MQETKASGNLTMFTSTSAITKGLCTSNGISFKGKMLIQDEEVSYVEQEVCAHGSGGGANDDADDHKDLGGILLFLAEAEHIKYPPCCL